MPASSPRGEFLPAASYSLVQQVNEKGVFSFCMCPGGIIAPAATDNEEIVVNGWSPSKRNNPFANSGMVVTAELKDIETSKEFKSFLGGQNPVCSYLPGVAAADLRAVLPAFIHRSLQQAFKEFGKKMKGYLTNEAIVVATESRTSSPVRIPRDAATLQHPQLESLYPCGEGAGYAGGIVSAAMDGERVASAIAASLTGG
jgi:uncharacterized FAD-dependent dehydrogenase